MHDPNFMALALMAHRFSENDLNAKNTTKVSEPYYVGQDSKLNIWVTLTLQDDLAWPKFHGSSPYSF